MDHVLCSLEGIQDISAGDIAKAVSLFFPSTLRRQQYIPRAGGTTTRVVIMHNDKMSAFSSVWHNASHWMMKKNLVQQWK